MAVGTGVAVGFGVAVGLGVAVGIGVAVGLGVAVGIGVPVGASVGTGVADGMGVGVGTGVYVGLGVGVGSGVRVGSGVFSSMVGGWSPRTGDSSVGRVENMPAGAVGVPAVSSLESPQAIAASRATQTAAIINSIPGVFRPWFLNGICMVTPTRFLAAALSWFHTCSTLVN